MLLKHVRMKERGEAIDMKKLLYGKKMSATILLGILGNRASRRVIPIEEFDVKLIPQKAIIELCDNGAAVRMTYGSMVEKLNI